MVLVLYQCLRVWDREMNRYQCSAKPKLSLLIILTCPAACFSACAGTSSAPVSTRGDSSDSNSTVTTSKPSSSSTTKTVTRKTQTRPLEKANAKKGFHIVSKGETLYAIAWRYGFDFRDISKWNGISAPYTIYPDQVVRLKPPPASSKKNLQPGPVVSKESQSASTKSVSKKPTAVSVKPVETKKPATPSKPKKIVNRDLKWQWPVKGKIIKTGSLTSKNGIDISGKFGDEIKSAEAGSVVYSGSGLLGYGRLIIIKHNETYLSAYAHNSELLVQEGDEVTVGQKIARMGKNSSGQTLLHFEIRKNGKSVNPSGLLPGS